MWPAVVRLAPNIVIVMRRCAEVRFLMNLTDPVLFLDVAFAKCVYCQSYQGTP